MVDPGVVVSVPLSLRLMAMDFDRRAVDVECYAGQLLAAPLGPKAAAGQLEHRLA